MRLPDERPSATSGLRIELRALARRPFLVLLVALGARSRSLRLLLDPHPIDLLVARAWSRSSAFAAVREREEVAGIEGTRRTEAESFARILRGLARSVSPDAIVDAIVEELGVGTGADHVAVVRRRPEAPHPRGDPVADARRAPPRRAPRCRCRELEDPAEDEAAVRARDRGRPRPAPDRRPDRARSRRRSRSSSRWASRRTGWRSSARARGREGLGLDRSRRRPTAYATMPPAARRRGRHAVPAREGADQRIADRIADRLRDAYGLRQRARRAAARQRPDRGRDRPVAPDPRPVAGVAQPDPRGRRGRGVRGARPRLLAARGGGPRHDRRADRPARTAATSTSTSGCSPSAAAPRTRSAC